VAFSDGAAMSDNKPIQPGVPAPEEGLMRHKHCVFCGEAWIPVIESIARQALAAPAMEAPEGETALELLKEEGWLENWCAKLRIGCYSLHPVGTCDHCDFWRDLRAKRAALRAKAVPAPEPASVERVAQTRRSDSIVYLPCGHGKWDTRIDCLTCCQYTIEQLNQQLVNERIDHTRGQSAVADRERVYREALEYVSRNLRGMKGLRSRGAWSYARVLTDCEGLAEYIDARLAPAAVPPGPAKEGER
jgi:hypothetical protein